MTTSILALLLTSWPASWAADSGKSAPTYAQGDERSSEPVPGAQKPELPKKGGAAPAGAAAAASPKERAPFAKGGPTDDSGAAGAMPKDFEVDLPAPTQKEVADALIQAAQGGSVGGRILAAATTFLGLPYSFHADGVHSTDCSKMTRSSMIKAGLADKKFIAYACMQYRYAETGQYDMHLVKDLQPGDFVFFNYHNAFCAARYKGIGHVGFYVGPSRKGAIYILHASSGAMRVVKGWVSTKYLAGIGRVVPKR